MRVQLISMIMALTLFNLQFNSSSAQSCPATCATCNSWDGCASCITGYLFTGNYECIENCDSTNHCYQCINCSPCSAFECSQCEDGYVMTGLNGVNTCVSCATAYPNCTSCSDGQCVSCQAGYIVQDDGTCCNENCMVCGNPECTACNDGYYFVNGDCQAGSCTTLYPNCSNCGSMGCYTCEEKFIYINGQCQKGNCTTFYSNCGAHTCDNTGCTQCNDGYELQSNGNCFDPNYTPWYQYVLGVIAMIFLCCCCACLQKSDGGSVRTERTQRYALIRID